MSQPTDATQPAQHLIPHPAPVQDAPAQHLSTYQAPMQGAPAPQAVQPYAQHGTPYGAPAGQMMVAPKNPALHTLASFFVPGFGQALNGQVGKGIGFFVAYAISWMLSFIVIGIPMLIVCNIWGMVDAYRGAQRWNAQHGIIS